MSFAGNIYHIGADRGRNQCLVLAELLCAVAAIFNVFELEHEILEKHKMRYKVARSISVLKLYQFHFLWKVENTRVEREVGLFFSARKKCVRIAAIKEAYPSELMV